MRTLEELYGLIRGKNSNHECAAAIASYMGENINADVRGGRILLECVSMHRLECIRVLAARGDTDANKKSLNGVPAIFDAVFAGPVVLRVFLNAFGTRIDVDVVAKIRVNFTGTPLHYAMLSYGLFYYSECVRLLLEHGADPTISGAAFIPVTDLTSESPTNKELIEFYARWHRGIRRVWLAACVRDTIPLVRDDTLLHCDCHVSWEYGLVVALYL